MSERNKRICENGHTYYKSSDCPVCPICEANRTPAADFMNMLSAPARRVLERHQILSLQQLAEYSVAELLKLHGIGPSSIPELEQQLAAAGLSFKND